MAGLILCRGKRAKEPYIFASEGTRIYSLEELCYELIHFPQMPPEDLFCGELIDWIKDEIGLDDLAERLRVILQKNDHSQVKFAMEILQESGYATGTELNYVRQTMRELEMLSALERRKIYADAKLKEKRLYRAKSIYEEILSKLSESDGDERLRSRLLHNIGVVYAQMFLFETAADYFKRAYLLSESSQSFDAYRKALYASAEDKEELVSLRLLMPSDVSEISKEVEETLGRVNLDSEVATQKAQPDENNMDFIADAQKCIRNWKSDYLMRTENGLVAKDFWRKEEA